MAVPNRIRERIQQGLKRMVPIIQQQKARDVSEADIASFGSDKHG